MTIGVKTTLRPMAEIEEILNDMTDVETSIQVLEALCAAAFHGGSKR